jgi:hypothetical protein
MQEEEILPPEFAQNITRTDLGLSSLPIFSRQNNRQL